MGLHCPAVVILLKNEKYVFEVGTVVMCGVLSGIVVFLLILVTCT